MVKQSLAFAALVVVMVGFVWVMGSAEIAARERDIRIARDGAVKALWMEAVANGHAEVFIDDDGVARFRWK